MVYIDFISIWPARADLVVDAPQRVGSVNNKIEAKRHVADLRKRHIEEKRTAVSTALGKMAGCFFGAGIALVVAWTILAL